MKVKAIIAAGGVGERLKAECPKPFARLNGCPLIVHTLKVFQEAPLIEGIVVAAREAYIPEFKDMIRQYGLNKVEDVTAGGPTRCESVYNGLKKINDETEIVVVHDGARPFLRERVLIEAVEQCQIHGAVVVGVPVKPTIKRIDPSRMSVKETLDRQELWEIQTPQVFRRGLLLEAYAKKGDANPTDDAALVEGLGVEVKVVRGDYENIKITTREDLIAAEAFLNAGRKERG